MINPLGVSIVVARARLAPLGVTESHYVYYDSHAEILRGRRDRLFVFTNKKRTNILTISGVFVPQTGEMSSLQWIFVLCSDNTRIQTHTHT